MKHKFLAFLMAGALVFGSVGAPMPVMAEGSGNTSQTKAVTGDSVSAGDVAEEVTGENNGDGEGISAGGTAGSNPSGTAGVAGGAAGITGSDADGGKKEPADAAGDANGGKKESIDAAGDADGGKKESADAAGDAAEKTEEATDEISENTALDPAKTGEPAIFWEVTDDGRIQIRLTGDASYPDLRFAVWSDDKGQDDLIWTTAKTTDQKTFVADFEVAKLKSLGTVHIHAYTGMATFVMKSTVELEGASVGKVSVENLDVAAGTCTLVLSELVHPELLKEVVVPVWSDAKQADLVWYQAEKVPGATLSELTYQVQMNISRHSFNIGTYHVHVYSRDISGKQLYQTSIQVTYPVSGEVAILPTSDAAVYQATVNNLVVPGGWSEMRFAVWSDEGGQDDLRWINTKTTSANININDFKHLGLYNVHLYAVGRNGVLKFVGKATFTPSVAEPVVELGAQGSDGSVEILVKNMMMQSSLKDVRAAVWSANKGQDDLKWYSAVKQSDGTYKIVANLKNHKDSGQYYIHVYAEKQDGKMQFLGKTDDLVVAAPKTATVTVSDVKAEGGEFTVKIMLPDDAPTVSKMQVPVWCAADQTDLKWYDAVKKADGSYEAVVRSSNHKEHAGTYQIHVYATYANGVFAFIGKTTQEMKVPPITVMNGTKGKRTLEIHNCEAAKAVSVAVWTSQGSQDDLIWYPASKNSAGAWQIVVDASKHKHGGEYIAHVYADNKMAGNITFEMPYNELKTTWTDMAGSMKVAAANNQLILVSASGTSAQITMLNKNTDGTWFQLLTASGYVGINGVGPTTEWNRRTPPGVFGFTKAFGILPNPGTAFQYTQVDSSHYWVDDVNSKYYNKFVSTRSVAPDWSSAEHLIDYTGSYGYCLAIDYNPECTPGVGSAIFLHCSAGRPTAGCVSVPESVMRRIMQLVDPGCKIVIENGTALGNY